ncbi:MAG: hypothetical protein ABIJ75_10560 [Actinomycetota bacterium]
MDSRFTRTKGGKMIHLFECRHAKNGVPWGWADTVTSDTFLLEVAEDFGLARCSCCDPLGERGVD